MKIVLNTYQKKVTEDLHFKAYSDMEDLQIWISINGQLLRMPIAAALARFLSQARAYVMLSERFDSVFIT